MKKIWQLIPKDLEILNQVIIKDLNSEIILINQISQYIINSGGKRLRPLITLLCGRIAGYKDGQILHQMAAMIEYIHTATLLHDDVVDESSMRRGKKTANAVFGNAASILVGDFIYTRAFQMMVKSQSVRLLEVMANSTNKISEGEVLQLLNIGKSNLTEEEYFQVIQYKTAVLFEAGARAASIVANASSSIEMLLSNYAINLGTAFQIVDDILDYTGNTNDMGKNALDDLVAGKVTLPIIYLLRYSKNKSKIIEALEKPDNANIKFIIHAIHNSEAIPYCTKLANHYTKQAIKQLEEFPDSIYKSALTKVAHMATNRIK